MPGSGWWPVLAALLVVAALVPPWPQGAIALALAAGAALALWRGQPGVRAAPAGLARRWLRRRAAPRRGLATADSLLDRALAQALAMPTILAVLAWCLTRAELRLGWTIILPPAPDWRVGAALLLAAALALAAPMLGTRALRRWPRAGRVLPWSIGLLAMSYASWAAGPVSLAVALAAGLRGRVRGPLALGIVAATVFWAAAYAQAGLRLAETLGWGLWILALWRIDRRRAEDAAGWRRMAALAVWAGGVAVGLRLLPWQDMQTVLRVLVLFLVLLPAVLAPGMLIAAAAAAGALRQVAERPGRAPALLGATLGLALALSGATAAALVAVLAAMPGLAGGVLVAPGPALIAARIDPSGHLWLLTVVMLPVLPVVLAAAAGGRAAMLALRQRGWARPPAALVAAMPAAGTAMLAAAAGLLAAPALIPVLEPLAR